MVYLVESEDGFHKIGFTRRDINKRIKELQISNANKLTPLKTYNTEYGSKIEKYLHRYFSHKKKQGEWFELDNDDIQKFNGICESFEANFKTLKEMGNPFI